MKYFILISIIIHIHASPINFRIGTSYRKNYETIPRLTENLFQHYNNPYNRQYLNSGNIELRSQLDNNLQYIAQKLIDKFRNTLQFYTENNYKNNIHAVKYIHPERTTENIVKTTAKTVEKSTDKIVSSTETYLPEKSTASIVHIQPEIQDISTEKIVKTTAEIVETSTEKIVTPTEPYLPEKSTESIVHVTTRFQPEIQEISTTKTVTTTENMLKNDHVFGPTPTENTEVKEVDYFSELSVPNEENLNIFVKNNKNELNSSKGSSRDDTINVIVVNNDTKSPTKVLKVIYNFPLPELGSVKNFRVDFKDIRSLFHTQFSGESPPNLGNFIPQDEVLELELPHREAGNFQEEFQESRQIKNLEIFSEENFDNLGEIPLEENPVFDLGKMNLVNSYGKIVTQFKK